MSEPQRLTENDLLSPGLYRSVIRVRTDQPDFTSQRVQEFMYHFQLQMETALLPAGPVEELEGIRQIVIEDVSYSTPTPMDDRPGEHEFEITVDFRVLQPVVPTPVLATKLTITALLIWIMGAAAAVGGLYLIGQTTYRLAEDVPRVVADRFRLLTKIVAITVGVWVFWRLFRSDILAAQRRRRRRIAKKKAK